MSSSSASNKTISKSPATNAGLEASDLPVMRFEARKAAIRQNFQGDLVVVFAIHPDEIPPQLIRSRPGSRYAVALVEIDEQEFPVDRIGFEERKRAQTRLAICLKDPLFQEYAFRRSKERGLQLYGTIDFSDPLSAEEAARMAVCELLGIDSRTAVGRDAGVAARWLEMERDFRACVVNKMVDGRGTRVLRMSEDRP